MLFTTGSAQGYLRDLLFAGAKFGFKLTFNLSNKLPIVNKIIRMHFYTALLVLLGCSVKFTAAGLGSARTRRDFVFFCFPRTGKRNNTSVPV
jgi:hypothetical protein